MTPDFPRPVLFDLEDDIRRQLDLRALFQNHELPGFVGRLRQNLAAWVRNDRESRQPCFDNLAVAGDRILDLYTQTAARSQAVIDRRTATGSLLQQFSNGGVADLHVAINSRFVLNPGQDPAFASFTQLDWVRARVPKRLIVHIGHNHGLYAVGSDAVVPGQGVTGDTDGVPYFDQWTELAKHLADLPAEVGLIVVCLLPKVGAVANLRPKGSDRDDGYAAVYEPVFSIEPNILSGAQVASVDRSIREANARIEETVRTAAQAKGTAGRLRFVSVYDLFDRFDFKNSGDPGRRLPIPGRPTIDNLYLDRTPLLLNLIAGGFQSADGMHASGAGSAMLASEVMTALGLAHDRGPLLQHAFDEDLLLSTKSPNLDVLLTILGSIRRSQTHLGMDLTDAIGQDRLGIAKVLRMAKAIFMR